MGHPVYNNLKPLRFHSTCISLRLDHLQSTPEDGLSIDQNIYYTWDGIKLLYIISVRLNTYMISVRLNIYMISVRLNIYMISVRLNIYVYTVLTSSSVRNIDTRRLRNEKPKVKFHKFIFV